LDQSGADLAENPDISNMQREVWRYQEGGQWSERNASMTSLTHELKKIEARRLGEELNCRKKKKINRVPEEIKNL